MYFVPISIFNTIKHSIMYVVFYKRLPCRVQNPPHISCVCTLWMPLLCVTGSVKLASVTYVIIHVGRTGIRFISYRVLSQACFLFNSTEALRLNQQCRFVA